MFFAGTETTSNSLQLAIAVLVRYPDTQSKVQCQLDRMEVEVITMELRAVLGYVEAKIYEICRVCHVNSFGQPWYAFNLHTNSGPDEMLNPVNIGRKKCPGKMEKIGKEQPSLEPNVGFTNKTNLFSFLTKISIR